MLMAISKDVEILVQMIRSLSAKQKHELARRLDEEAVLDHDQSWYWSQEWQEAEKEADEDIAAGRVHHYGDVDELLNSLHTRRKKELEKCD